jgi:hypothetical protein
MENFRKETFKTGYNSGITQHQFLGQILNYENLYTNFSHEI